MKSLFQYQQFTIKFFPPQMLFDGPCHLDSFERRDTALPYLDIQCFFFRLHFFLNTEKFHVIFLDLCSRGYFLPRMTVLTLFFPFIAFLLKFLLIALPRDFPQ